MNEFTKEELQYLLIELQGMLDSPHVCCNIEMKHLYEKIKRLIDEYDQSEYCNVSGVKSEKECVHEWKEIDLSDEGGNIPCLICFKCAATRDIQMNLDKTFCASPNCKNECGRKMTDAEESIIYDSPRPISYGYFCGNPDIEFRPGDLVYWIYPNEDKSLCTVKEIKDNESMWVTWHKDNFTNIIPKKGFIHMEK